VFAQPENEEIEVGGFDPRRRAGGPRSLYPPRKSAMARPQLRCASANIGQREKREAKPLVVLLNLPAHREIPQRAANRGEIRYSYYELVLFICLDHALLHGLALSSSP